MSPLTDESGDLREQLAVAHQALTRLSNALRWYADERHWKEDDWGVQGVVAFPEYGTPGRKARNALKAGSVQTALSQVGR
jgi:hypothetical protein